MTVMTITAQTIYDLEKQIREIKAEFKQRNNLNNILISICDTFGYDPEEITGKCRQRPLPDIRKILAHEAKEKGHSVCVIGRFINRDHSTISVMLKEYKNRNGLDPEFSGLVEQFEKEKFSPSSYGIEDLITK